MFVKHLMQPYQREFLEKRYGFRAYSLSNDPEGKILNQVKASVEELVKQPISFSNDGVLWNDDFIFVPWGWIGCSGYLFDRRSYHVISLGTMLTPDEWVWAIYRGCDVDSWRAGVKCKETLVIHSVRKPKELLKTLSWYLRFDRRFVDFDRQIQKLPLTICNIALIYAVPGLLEAEKKGYFDFEIKSTPYLINRDKQKGMHRAKGIF